MEGDWIYVYRSYSDYLNCVWLYWDQIWSSVIKKYQLSIPTIFGLCPNWKQ